MITGATQERNVERRAPPGGHTSSAPGETAVPARRGGAAVKQPPFYPHHWRLVMLLVVGVALYLAAVYAPALWQAARRAHTETQRLSGTLLDEGALAARRARLAELRQMESTGAWAFSTPAPPMLPGAQRPGADDPLDLVQRAADASGAVPVEVRLEAPGRVRGLAVQPVAVRAQGDFLALLRFAAALENGAPLVTAQNLALETQPAGGEQKDDLILTTRLLVAARPGEGAAPARGAPPIGGLPR